MKRSRSIGSFFLTIILLVVMSTQITGCGSKEKVKLSVWTTEAKVDLIKGFVDEFQKLHKDEIELDCRVSKENEDSCKETILGNPEGAADIFAFADDQLDDLKTANCLLEIPGNPDKVLAPYGGERSLAYQSVVRDGKIFAYPETANGYFLYYNKKYLNEQTAASLDKMVETAGLAGKKVVMDYSSGWYLYSFFKGAGLSLNPDDTGVRNICNWNGTGETGHTGLEVAKYIEKLAVTRGFQSVGDDEFVAGAKDGSIIAGVNGAWNADAIKEAWGDNYAATKLPTYRLGDDEVQMASFTGYKVLGISAKTKHPEWCQKLVEFITSKENQVKEFEQTGEVPANHEVLKTEQVKNDPAVTALAAQEEFASLQRVAAPYWDASSKFGVTLASGNPDKEPVESLLDKMVKGITQ